MTNIEATLMSLKTSIMKACLQCIMLLAVTAFTACSGDDNDTGTQPEDVVTGTNHNILIAYFSEPLPDNGVDAATSASRIVVNGDTYGSVEYMATVIGEATGGDMVRIQTAQPYPQNYNELAEQANEERLNNVHPEQSTDITNFSDYDVVFVGYPIWWYQMPMPLYSFFDKYDFAGKRIIPFSSHGGSGWSGTVDDISALEPDATMVTGLSISRGNVASSADDILEWLNDIGITNNSGS